MAEAVASNTFCTLATSSAEHRPHVAAVLYALVGRDLYINTDAASRKARKIGENGVSPFLLTPVYAARSVSFLKPSSYSTGVK